MECHDCKFRNDPNRLERCLKCQPYIDGQPMHVGRNAVVYTDAHERLEDAIKRKELPRQTENVTNLPADVEDALRGALATYAGLKPIDALLVHHLLGGNSLASFRDTLRKLCADILKMGEASVGDRSYAWTRAQYIGGKFAPFRDLFPRKDNKNKGGGMRPKKQKEYIQEEFL